MAKDEEKQLTFFDAATNAKLEYLRNATGKRKRKSHSRSGARPRKPKGKPTIDDIDELRNMGGKEVVKKMLETAEELANLNGGQDVESVKRMIEFAEGLSRLGGPERAREVLQSRETLDAAIGNLRIAYRRVLAKGNEEQPQNEENSEE